MSFRDAQEVTTLGFHFWNRKWSLTGYEFLFNEGKILKAYGNTIFRTVC